MWLTNSAKAWTSAARLPLSPTSSRSQWMAKSFAMTAWEGYCTSTPGPRDRVDGGSVTAQVVRGKGHREERLPLPVDVGEALVDYLCQSRPSSWCTRLFLRVRAPHHELTKQGIRGVVRWASVRASLPVLGALRLRHTAAACADPGGGRVGIDRGQRTGRVRSRRTLLVAFFIYALKGKYR